MLHSLHVLNVILKRSHADKILWGFLGLVFFSAFLIDLFEPDITNYGDALWYCYAVVTTVGFGDICVTSLLAKVVSVLLSFYAVIVIAILTGVIVDYYSEVAQAQQSETLSEYLDKLENLPKLSHEELVEISEKVKAMR
ncbi:MAG: potassium channel family protein [Atopobiaceae bacterium]|jgi:voltage-gated potassium channel|nr:potassium channel family protein [Atopobiaceae bacterium]